MFNESSLEFSMNLLRSILENFMEDILWIQYKIFYEFNVLWSLFEFSIEYLMKLI